MALDATDRPTGPWPKAVVFSLCLHGAVVVWGITASSPRRHQPLLAPIEVTVLKSEAPALLQPPPVAEVAPGATDVRRPSRSAVRPRLERVPSQRERSPLESAPTFSTSSAPPAPEPVEPAAIEAPGEVVAKGPSAQVGNGAGQGRAAGPVVQESDADGVPRILPPAEGNGQLAIDPNEARYQPVIPLPLRKAGVRFAPFLKLCVRKDGSVGSVTVVRPSDPAVDPAIVEKMRLFRFRPYLDHGRPIPFCFFREYRLSVEQ